MEREWRCSKCDTLHDVERGARLHLRYRQAQYVRSRPEDVDAWIAEQKERATPVPGVAR
jgi:hypothetical protein